MIKIWWVFLFPIVLSSKLNVPRVLLPLSPKYLVNFTLEVTDDRNDCFSWSSSRPDVVVVIPITDNNQCSKKATIVPTGLFTHKTSAIVIAKHLDNTQVLRCDVILNHIHSLQISMKTHELYIEDAPEEFHVRAWDNQGNEFSSLSDLPFEWTFGGKSVNGGTDNEPILRWVKFEESLYDVADPSISKMERKGLKGHTILIEGMKTGSTTVSVKLQDDFFKSVPSVEAKIVVQANLIIEPSEVFVLPGSTIPLTVSLIRQGKASVIHLPSSNYYLKAENSEVAEVVGNDAIIQAGEIGTSRVFLLDRNVESPDVSHAPHVLIHVVYPHKLALKFLPHLSWTTMIDESHIIQVDMYDDNGNFILCNDLISIDSDIPSTFAVNHVAKNGSYHQGVVTVLGSFEVKASLKSLKMPSGADIPLEKVLETTALLTVLPRMSLKPPRYVLAWDPVTAPSYQVKYEVVNGAKPHDFMTTNSSFSSINADGEATSRGLGSCIVSAHLIEHPHLKADAKLYVLPVSSMTVIYQLVEIEVGSHFDIPVFMKGVLPDKSEVEIDDCSKVTLDAVLTHPELFELKRTPVPNGGSGCRLVSVTASGVAITTLTLSLKTESNVLQQRVTISSYHPLRHQRPRKGFATLAIGSCSKVVLKGGPTPSNIHPASQFRKVTISNETVVPPSQAQIVSKSGQNQKPTEILVCCTSEGDSDVRYVVGSTSSVPYYHLADASISTKIFCVHPYRVSLLPSIRRPAEEYAHCKDQVEPNRYVIQNYIESKIELIVEDKFGRRLDNFSSYKVAWVTSDVQLGTLEYVEAAAESEENEAHDYLTFHPLKKEGLFTINLSMSPPEINDHEDVHEISGSLELNAVNEVTAIPSKSTIMNHPDVKLTLGMLGGSGYYKVLFEPSGIAKVQHLTQNRTVQVIPLQGGNLELTVVDRCLWSPKSTSVSVQIVEVSRIQLQVADKVELGSSIPLTVQMYDASDNLLAPEDLHSVQLEPILGSSIVRVKSVGPLDFLLEGVALGETTVSVKAANRESPIVGLQVFPPLRISPRNLTLVVGATFQVVGFGGPQPDTTIQFSIDGADVANCSYNGIITARKLGRTEVRARAVGVDRYTGLERVYSEDQAEVHVKPLTGIRITAPMTRVRQGTEMPISFAGLDDAETPFAFGDANPLLKAEWTVTNALSGTIHSLMFNTSKFPPGDSDIAIRFIALQPGETVLKLKVTSRLDHQQLKALQFTDELTIHVYEALTITNMNFVTSHSLLMMPETTLNLKTSTAATRVVQKSSEQTQRVIQIDSEGNLRSESSMGHTNLLLTSTNGHGIVQNLNLFVEVRPVSYLLPTASGILWDEGSQSMVIPRGFDARILVTYHDSLGRTFHGVRTDLKLRASRQDNHRISYDASKSVISFEGDQPGTTVIQIYDNIHHSLGVYIRFKVINAILPEQLDLRVGDVICFTSQLLSSHGLHGKWSSDLKLMDVDEDSGVALISHEGFGQLKYRTGDGQTTVGDVSVSPAAVFRFHDAYSEVITNSDDFLYRFPVILRNKNEPSLAKSSCGAEKVASFFSKRPSKLSCHLSFAANNNQIPIGDVFQVESGFDPRSGFHQCIIKPVSTSAALSRHAVAQLTLKAQYGSLSADLSLTWEPAFVVTTPVINFGDVEETAFLEISAQPSVIKNLEFLLSDTSALKLDDKHVKTAAGVRIPVHLNSYYLTRAALPLTIDIRNRLTAQTEKANVSVGVVKGKSAPASSETGFGVLSYLWDLIQSQTLSLLTVAGTCMAIYLGYKAFNNKTYYRPLANGKYPRTPPQRLAEPSPLNTSFAKRTPQLWSVPNESISSPFDQSAHSAFRSSPLSNMSSFSSSN